MIDEVMYGMIPSAKIVRRREFPPLKRSKMPSTEPADCLKISSRTAVLIPGVGMCAPRRYTARSPSVKKSRFRRSSIRKRFANAWMKRFLLVPRVSRLRYNLECSARLGDLFLGGGAECMGVDGELGFQLAIAQNLDGIRCAADEAVRAQQIRRHRFARGEHVKFLEVDDGVGDAKRIVKAALRNAAMQRHLPAFKTPAARIAAARLLSLVAGASGPAQFRTHAAADAHLFLARALWRAEV